jgi:hypothetical protein
MTILRDRTGLSENKLSTTSLLPDSNNLHENFIWLRFDDRL